MRKSIFSILTAVIFLASALLSCGPASDGGSLTEPEQTETADSTTAWILVLGSAVCLALGLTIALIYKRHQHIDA